MYPRLEAALRASHKQGEATGVGRWEPPPGLYDEHGNRTAPWPRPDEMPYDDDGPPGAGHFATPMLRDGDGGQPEVQVDGNPYRLPSRSGGWASCSAAEGERQENERMVDQSLINTIPLLQQHIQSLTQKVTELQEKVRGIEAREDTLLERLIESGALPGFRSLS
jgi:hypothetical protein